ncbi:helix-turn-helix domain-containing protein [Changchengzhania lutea]|uniref:helix-turn-helix domain-containing protein n=1 Tax=Changchengzhania lutea TaxID=2049305 RepID=UPI00115E18B6|nr:AraC family transcriptional regulator [Changchengzhania lutea]
MIIESKTFTFLGKAVFNKIIIRPPFELPGKMIQEACFIYVLEGQHIEISEDSHLSVTKGESVLKKCGNYLSRVNVTKKDVLNNIITIHFYPETLKAIYADKLPDFLKQSNKVVVPNMTKVKANGLLEKYFDSLLFYFENQELVDDEILKLKIKELILLLVKTQNDQTVFSILSNLFTPRIYNLKEIINAHIYTAISIDQLANLTFLSRSSFIREFKKEYNQNPAHYIKNKKLERAAELLTYSSEPISAIAYDCGFNNPAHFSRSFYSKYNASPSKYRLEQIGN